jgi:hypothetical protein
VRLESEKERKGKRSEAAERVARVVGRNKKETKRKRKAKEKQKKRRLADLHR